MFDELLKPFGLNYEDLDEPGYMGEKETLLQMVKDLEANKLTLDTFRDYVIQLRTHVQQELVKIYEKEASQSWLSALSYLIPLVGIIRKWYTDKREIYLKARLDNYMLLEAFFNSREKANEEIRKRIEGLKN